MCNKQYDFIKDEYRQLNIYVNGYKKLQNSSYATEQNLNLFRECRLILSVVDT